MPPITQKDLDQYKVLMPHDEKLQSLTLFELLQNVDNSNVDYSKITYKDSGLLEGSTWSCVEGIGFVVFDCVCLVLGAVSLRSSVTSEVAEDIAKAVEPVVPKLEQYIKTIKAAESSKTDIAWAVFGVISTIYSGSCLGAVLSSFLGSLTWYNSILYGATAMGTILAACFTDGAAEVGIIVVELATAGFLVQDSINCGEACGY